MRGAGGVVAMEYVLFSVAKLRYSRRFVTFYAGKAGAVVRIFGVDKSDVVL